MVKPHDLLAPRRPLLRGMAAWLQALATAPAAPLRPAACRLPHPLLPGCSLAAPAFAAGQIGEIVGPPEAYKTSLCLALLAAVQAARPCGRCVVVDPGCALSPQHLRRCGVGDEVLVVRLHVASAALVAATLLVATGHISLVLFDAFHRLDWSAATSHAAGQALVRPLLRAAQARGTILLGSRTTPDAQGAASPLCLAASRRLTVSLQAPCRRPQGDALLSGPHLLPCVPRHVALVGHET